MGLLYKAAQAGRLSLPAVHLNPPNPKPQTQTPGSDACTLIRTRPIACLTGLPCRRARHRLQDLGLDTMICGQACLGMPAVLEDSLTEASTVPPELPRASLQTPQAPRISPKRHARSPPRLQAEQPREPQHVGSLQQPQPRQATPASSSKKQQAGKKSPLRRFPWAHRKQRSPDAPAEPKPAKHAQAGASEVSRSIAARIQRLRAAGVQG